MVKKLAALAALVAILAIGLFTGAPRTARGIDPPPNDTFANATLISKIPFEDSLNTVYATANTNDPVPGCASFPIRNVWYKYTPAFTQTVDISTLGTSFDTVIALYVGTKGALNQVGCNDNDGQTPTSFLKTQLEGGITYYIQAGGVGSASGTLALSLTPQDPFFFDDIALKCYQAKLAKRTLRFQRETILTNDQNLRRRWETTVTGLSLYCNQAELGKIYSGEAAADPFSPGNLKTTCYAARDARNDAPPVAGTAVFAQNEFGDQKLVLGRLESICVLALKDDGVLPGFSPFNGQILRCYTARPVKGSPRFQSIDIVLADQFDEKDGRVLRPVTYCNLSSKSAELDPCIAADCAGGNGNDGVAFIPHEFSVVCYSLRQASFLPFNIPVIDQFIDRQFNDPLITIRRADRLCLSSTKKPPFAENDDFPGKEISVEGICLATTDFCPFEDHVVTMNATRATNDPPLVHCESVTDDIDYGHSVWYQFNPLTPADTDIEISTQNSTYDTVVVVYTGSKGDLTQIACNDDLSIYNPTSFLDLELNLEDGPYYIMVGSKDRTPGGKLKFLLQGQCETAGPCD